ncbi:MAG: DUF4175 family protein [Bacteroidota bacterium]
MTDNASGTPRIYRELLERLTSVRRTEGVLATLLGFFLFGAVSIAAVLLALTIEHAFFVGTIGRTILFWLLITFAIILFVWKVIIPALRLAGILSNETIEATASRIGRKFPHLNDHLVNILQLYTERDKPQLYSVDLIDASFEDVRKEIQSADFNTVVDTTTPKRAGKLFFAMCAIAVLVFVLFPSGFFGAAHRLVNYGESFDPPLPFTFIVEPGSKEVVKGETVPVIVRIEGEQQKQIVFAARPAGQVAFEETILNADSTGMFVHDIPSLKNSTTYYVYARDIRSDEYALTVVDRPIVKAMKVQLQFPTYAKLQARELEENIGDVTALKGTRITFSVESNKPLATASVVFNDKTEKSLDVRGEKATGSLTLMADRTYHIALTDVENLTNVDPIEYTLKVIPDAFPTAAILVPGANIDIAENATLNMLMRITDDYGFTTLRLAHKLIQSRYERPADEYSFTDIPLAGGQGTEREMPYVWALSNQSLVPEDVISYYIEVFDNDNISGPKSAKSEIYTLRLPSIDEVFADLDRSHEVSLEGMKEAMKQAEEARKELEELQQELRKNQQKMTWQEQKKAEELAKQYQELQKKMEEVNKTVDQMINQMEQNQSISKETMEKYQELQQLMEQMNSPEFSEAMKKMQEAMQQMNPEAMKQAMQEFKFSEENFRKSIERTMNLMKRIQIEQKVDEALKRMEEMMKQQEDLQKQTEQTSPQSKEKLDELAKQQKDLKEQMDQLQRELAELQKKMEEFPAEMPLDEMEKAMNEMEESDLQEQMEQIAEQMQQQQTQKAQQGQKQAMQKMGKMKQSLQQMQQAMQQNQQQQIVNEMRRSMQDLLELSKRQEALKNQSQNMEPNSQRFRENAQEQMEVMRDLAKVTEGLSKLSQKTFSISPEMGKSIGDAMRQMDQAMQSLEQRNSNSAGQQQGGAMGSLNEAANQMQGAMAGMMQPGGQGMGMAGMMQRLQQMSSTQQGINQGTQNLGGMTPQQAAEMGRLAGEQGMVRKSLEQLAREAASTGELSKLLGDLNRAAQEMREVQTDLAQGNVNPETVQKQDRILSRLLDSQRSMRERDYEKKRRAESGKDLLRSGPQALDLTTQDGRNRLRQDLLKATEEGYAKDYQELIRRYFEALEKNEPQN